MKILYIEDIEINAKLLSMFIDAIWGLPVTIATTAEDGLAQIKAQRFDLVFMDVNLPKMNGIDAVREIRKDYSMTELPIIMVSADVDQYTIDLSMNAGANDYITKPIDMQKLKHSTECLFRLEAI